MNKIFLYTFICLITGFQLANAESIKGLHNANPQNQFGGKGKAEGCTMPTASVDLDINNVRAKIMDAGDMWWDRGLEVARYEVPKIDPPGSAASVSSLFAGAIWIGGLDQSLNLRVAAQTYRQGGNDFFAGPLDANGSTDAVTCNNYDYFWKVNATEVASFKSLTPGAGSAGSFPSIFSWPAKGNPSATGANGVSITINDDLAPWVDVDGNPSSYNPENGDYPSFGGAANTMPDQMIFWVYNDKGNIHTETSSDPIGLQINTMAFAFKTSDDVNSMTFYRYDLYNKSTNQLDSTYIAQWLDPDLGCANDDYIGCDSSLGLGICYNADATDQPCPNGYGSDIPMVGIDFFEGPKDKQGKQLGMTGFYYYYNTTPSGLADPQNAVQYYGYMTGTWRDGTRFTFGGNAHGGTQTTKYVFTDAPNKSGINTATGNPYWSMCNPTPITPGDVRIVESSGPFSLIPGSKQRVTVGVVWVPSVTYPCPSFQKILTADATAQALFDAGFKLLDGPDAPDMAVNEYDKEIILTISNNDATKNNYKESYAEFASKILPQVIKVPGNPTKKDSINASYLFEGYQIYQMADQTLPATEDDYHDASKMRLIYQVDVKNGVKNIVNWYRDDANGGAFKPILQVSGNDAGINHTFKITQDYFASSNPFLVNFKTYYYLVVAYGYNNYKMYSDADPTSQALPYIRGRRNIKVYSAIPHIVTPQHGGTVLHSKFGDEPFVTRVEGYGNGMNFTNLSAESEAEILSKGRLDKLKYDTMGAPIEVRVFDPIKVPKADFALYLLDSFRYWTNSKWDTIADPVTPKDSIRKYAYWKLVNTTTGETKYSDRDISDGYDQLFSDWGFSVNIKQTVFPGTKKNVTANVGTPSQPKIVLTDIRKYAENNGFLGYDIDVESAVNFWYGFQAADQDGENGFNWIRSGTTWKDKAASPSFSWKWSDLGYGTGSFIDAWDKDQDFEKIMSGTWAPFALAAYDIGSNSSDATGAPIYNHEIAVIPGFDEASSLKHKMSDLFSFDIVFTSDKSKWTKCVVVETNNNPKNVSPTTAIAPSDRQRLKAHDSWSDYTNVNSEGNPVYDANSQGMSWFPGYAVNLETGERLNIVFGEDGKSPEENGNDMLWNPTSTVTKNGFGKFGGRHYIYVLSTQYSIEQVKSYANILGSGSVIDIRDSIYNMATWVGVPMMLNTGGLYTMKSAKDGIIPADLRLKIRVSKPYSFKDYGNNELKPGYPKFTFSMKDLAADTSVLDTAKSALDLINVVPNPYYANSNYEIGTLDSRIKITNLPRKCKISIYSVDGTLIRQFNRDTDNPTYQEWDLKNAVNVPIASGLYLIHIAADGLGKNKDQSAQRVIKWFGVMRQIDLNTF
jgi:hypothetical protein